MKSLLGRRKKAVFTISVLSGFLLLFFQNCSNGFAVKDEISSVESILDYAKKLDNQYLPTLLTSDNIGYWEKSAVAVIDNTPAFATDWSVIAVVDGTSDGDIISVNSGVNSEESRLYLTGGKVAIANIGDASNYYATTYPTTSLNSKTVFAFSSGPKLSDAIVLVDGYLQKAAAATNGANLDFSLLAKSIIFDSNRVKEIVVYPRALSAAELNVMSRYLASKNNISTVVLDPAIIDADGGGSSSSPEYEAAVAVINSRCLGCHSSSNNGDFRGLTTSKAIQKQLIVPGDLTNSKLYYRLQGSQVGSGPKTMPTDGAIPFSEVQAIEAWILSVQ